MSGNTDSSQPTDRNLFDSTVQAIGTCANSIAAAVQYCPLPVNELTAAALGMMVAPGQGVSYQMAAARVVFINAHSRG